MKTAEEVLQEKSRDIISVTINTTIHDALQKMILYKIGSILVEDKGQIVGIWTERDLMHNILDAKFDMKEAYITDFMTTCLPSVPHTFTCDTIMDRFLGMRLRHLLIEKEGQYIGILSAGDVMKATLQEKAQEYKELNFEVSWEYYENWHTPLSKTYPEENNLYLPYPANIQASRSL
jgi:signal-transduction protein with cAMP-binding, CBS, and nucleotidyltransferase domain